MQENSTGEAFCLMLEETTMICFISLDLTEGGEILQQHKGSRKWTFLYEFINCSPLDILKLFSVLDVTHLSCPSQAFPILRFMGRHKTMTSQWKCSEEDGGCLSRERPATKPVRRPQRRSRRIYLDHWWMLKQITAPRLRSAFIYLFIMFVKELERYSKVAIKHSFPSSSSAETSLNRKINPTPLF